MNFFNKFDKLKTYSPFKSNMVKVMMISVFSLLLITSGTSYAYLTYSKTGTSINTISSGNLSLTLSETTQLSLTNAVPQLDSTALSKNTGYSFTVTNSGNVTTNYTLYLNSICSTSQTYTVNSTSITPDVCLAPSFVNVGVSIGGGSYTKKTFSSSTLTIDSGTLSAGTSKSYTLKLWLDKSTPNTYNAYYNGTTRNVLFVSQINLTGVQSES